MKVGEGIIYMYMMIALLAIFVCVHVGLMIIYNAIIHWSNCYVSYKKNGKFVPNIIS